MPSVTKINDDYIKVVVDKSDLRIYTADEWTDLAQVINGIIKFIKRMGWREGWRNNMAVDSLIAAMELGLIDEETQEFGLLNDMIRNTGIVENAYLDFIGRENVIQEYLPSWKHAAPIYMLDKDFWIAHNAINNQPVQLVFADEDL